MGLKEILNALEAECNRAVKELETRALAQAERIKQEASLRAEEEKKLVLEAGKKRIEQEVKNIINRAEAQSRNIRAAARETTFRLILDRLKEIIAHDPAVRAAIIRKAISDAVEMLNGQLNQSTFYVSEKDKKVIEEELKKVKDGLKISVADNLDAGFYVEMQEGKINFKVTPEVVAGRLSRAFLPTISKRLFE